VDQKIQKLKPIKKVKIFHSWIQICHLYSNGFA